MSYGIGDVTNSYRDDPELRRRIEAMRAEQMRLDSSRAQPPQLAETQGGLDTLLGAAKALPGKFQAELPMFMAGLQALYEDPRRIAETPTAQSIKSGVTLPRDVIEGKIDPRSDEGIARTLDMAGTANLGSVTATAPAGSLAANVARRAKPKDLAPEALQTGVDVTGRYKYADPTYAEAYPPVPEPVTKFKNPKEPSEGTYLGKGESPETKAFMKSRAAIRKEMEAGYAPYFDPAKRADVDPANYPTDVDTLTQAVGAKPETRARHEAVANSADARARLKEAYEHGQTLGGGGNWYFMKQLEDEFIKELGPEAGRAAFRDKFAGQMAATTGGADPESNFLAAMYANYERQRGRDVPERAYDMPVPIGGRYISGNMEQANKYAAQGLGEFSLQNPKRHDFQYNFLGHGNKATIDEQMSGLIEPKLGGMPPSGNYGSYESVVHNLAKEYGVDPRYFQEVAWAGGKAMKDKGYKPHPMIETVNRSIERTSRLTGLSPDEVVRRGIVRSEMPMYERGVPLPARRKDEDDDKRPRA